MRPLTDLEARTLRPYGPPGEWSPQFVFDALIERDLMRLGSNDCFEPTELGELALRIYDAGGR